MRAMTAPRYLFSAHHSYKNWYQRGENWLINNRWEQLIAMRNQLTFIEMETWYCIYHF
jgi:glucan endo-1,3-alpha-glucosidase